MTVLHLVVGIFCAWLVNYLSDVLPRYRKFVSPTCSECQAELGWPFYVTMQPCKQCGARPSNRHWLVMFIVPVLAVLLRYFPAPVLGQWGGLFWLAFFALVVVIDMEHRLILHPVSLIGAVAGFVTGSIAHGILNTIIGGLAGFSIMLLFYYFGEVLIRFLSKRRGEEITEVALGFGDVNLAGILGLLLGWPGVIGGLVLTILLGGVASGIFLFAQVLRKKYQAYQALPYGPFLVLSVVILVYLAQSFQ
jgi:prepilin signal peptidase PulO-like enzyme (type II secretory pathway)